MVPDPLSMLSEVASREPFMAEKLRQTLVAFASTLPAAKLDAGLCGVPPNFSISHSRVVLLSRFYFIRDSDLDKPPAFGS